MIVWTDSKSLKYRIIISRIIEYYRISYVSQFSKWEDSNQTVVFVDNNLEGTACCGSVIGYFVVMLLALIYVS